MTVRLKQAVESIEKLEQEKEFLMKKSGMTQYELDMQLQLKNKNKKNKSTQPRKRPAVAPGNNSSTSKFVSQRIPAEITNHL